MSPKREKCLVKLLEVVSEFKPPTNKAVVLGGMVSGALENLVLEFVISSKNTLIY